MGGLNLKGQNRWKLRPQRPTEAWTPFVCRCSMTIAKANTGQTRSLAGGGRTTASGAAAAVAATATTIGVAVTMIVVVVVATTAMTIAAAGMTGATTTGAGAEDVSNAVQARQGNGCQC